MDTAGFIGALRRFAGAGANNTGHLEKLVSGAGGLTGILGILLVSQTYLGFSGGTALVASMGASAVLLFAVPHGPLSQPWAVVGGHLVSAVIGVACTRLGLDAIPSAALAVALAICAMYYLRCIHPPGGATALTAVAGGESIHALGFNFVLTPVLLNVLVILSVAILFNLAFPWRRYPAVWARKPGTPAASDGSATNDDAELSGTLAQCEAAEYREVHPADIRTGNDYCNGAFGAGWEVRRVIDCGNDAEAPDSSDTCDSVSYRVVAGNRRRQTGITSRETFADWARYEVCLNETSWQRIDTTSCSSRQAKPHDTEISGGVYEQSA